MADGVGSVPDLGGADDLGSSDSPGPGSPGPDRSGPDRSGVDRSDPDRSDPDRSDPDRSDPDRSGLDRPGPGHQPGFLLWRVTLRWQREIAAVLAPLDLTHVQFVLLACTYWLNHQGLSPNQATVAEQAATDVKMTSQVIRTLEAKGLITREIDPADTRARRLRVTPAGAELAPRAMAAVEAVDAAFFAPAADASGDTDDTDAVVMLRKLARYDQDT